MISDSYIGATEKSLINHTNLKADPATVSAFDLTVWAYRRQMVQYEVDRHGDFLLGRDRGNLIDELLAVSRGYDGRGCINGAGTSAAVAAHVIHAHVRGLPSRAQQLVIKAGASGKPPNWNPIVPPARVVPVWIGRAGTVERRSRRLWDVVINGRLKYLYGVTRKGKKSHEPVGCLIDYVGTQPAIAAAMIEAARNDYLIWWHGLADLATIFGVDPRLAGFRVDGIGVPREPWSER